MQTINCEITKVFDANDNGIGFALKPEVATDELKSLTKWNAKFSNITTTWWFNKKPQPKWLIEGTKIQFSWYEKNGYLNMDQASVEVMEESKDMSEDAFNAEIDAIAEEDEQERIAEQLAREAEELTKQTQTTDQKVKKIEIVKSNNPFEHKATDMEMAFMACRDKEFFKFFGRDLDALQKLVVTVFLSNR